MCILLWSFEDKRKLTKRYFKSKKYRYSVELKKVNINSNTLIDFFENDNFAEFKKIFFLRSYNKSICSLIYRFKINNVSNKCENSSLNSSIFKISRKNAYLNRNIFTFSHHKFIVSMNLININSWRLCEIIFNVFKITENIIFSREKSNMKFKVKISLTVIIEKNVMLSLSISSNLIIDVISSISDFWYEINCCKFCKSSRINFLKLSSSTAMYF